MSHRGGYSADDRPWYAGGELPPLLPPDEDEVPPMPRGGTGESGHAYSREEPRRLLRPRARPTPPPNRRAREGEQPRPTPFPPKERLREGEFSPKPTLPPLRDPREVALPAPGCAAVWTVYRPFLFGLAGGAGLGLLLSFLLQVSK